MIFVERVICMKNSIFRKGICIALCICLVLTIDLHYDALMTYADDNGNPVVDMLESVSFIYWKENSEATAIWEEVQDANYYKVLVKVYHEDGSFIGENYTGTTDMEIDVQQEINNIYTNAESEERCVVEKGAVVAEQYAEGNLVAASEQSNDTGYLRYRIRDRYKFETPQNVEISEDYIVSWDVIDNWEKANCYYLNIYFKDEKFGGGQCGFAMCSPGYNMQLKGNRLVADISEDVKRAFDDYVSYYDVDSVKVYVDVMAYPPYEIGDDGIIYIRSDISSYSNEVIYKKYNIVENILLSPNNPIIYKGNSFFLGKTIYPEDAHYDIIEWSSSDDDIVSVDSMGKITGNSVGQADIIATIGDAYGTVTANVYDISSNIEDEEQNHNVTDTAGDIIDDIANNDNPDLGNTDITEGDLEEVKEDIQQGVWRGDSFFTDLRWYEENFSKYKMNWGQIQKAARELNAQFAGAYNIEVEMYHKDKDGTEYHIGNITEMENEVTFTFDLPTGMSEIQSGETRKYVLVRIHNNQYEAIDVEVNDDGTFTASSNQYSDFVLLYVDTPKIKNGIEINGFQLNSCVGGIEGNGGIRTVYSVEPEIEGKSVVNSGLIYSLEGLAPKEEMYVGSQEEYVKSYLSTNTGKLSANMSDSYTATSYAMTMIFVNKSPIEYTDTFNIRAFAELEDGTFVYSDIYSFRIYDIADRIYKDRTSSNEILYQYLYDNILNRVTPGYELNTN